jgi:hypothetical protein
VRERFPSATNFDGGIFALRFDRRLIHQHDRNIVFHRIDPTTLRTFKSFRVLPIFERLLAGRTNEDLQQFLGNHDLALYDRAVIASTGVGIQNHARGALRSLCGISPLAV